MDIKNTTLDDISAVIGFSATLRLAAWFGDGSNLYIPKVLEEGHLLVKLIGNSAAKKLSEEWGSETLSIPRLRNYEDDVKRRTIGRMLERGFGWREISVFMRMSERRVQQICRELEAAGLINVVAPLKASGKKTPEKLGDLQE